MFFNKALSQSSLKENVDPLFDDRRLSIQVIDGSFIEAAGVDFYKITSHYGRNPQNLLFHDGDGLDAFLTSSKKDALVSKIWASNLKKDNEFPLLREVSKFIYQEDIFFLHKENLSNRKLLMFLESYYRLPENKYNIIKYIDLFFSELNEDIYENTINLYYLDRFGNLLEFIYLFERDNLEVLLSFSLVRHQICFIP